MLLTRYFLVYLAFIALISACGPSLPELSEQGVTAIRINQIGYTPGAMATVVINQQPTESVAYLVDEAGGDVLATFEIGDSINWANAGETVWTLKIKTPDNAGAYRIYVPGVGYSYPFKVAENVLAEVFKGSMKGLYYQRVSMALQPEYAGKWQRPAGHPDTAVLFHPFSGRISGKTSSPKGWYDAGDYNKYVINGSFPCGQLLALYEDIGDAIPDGQGNIPESHNEQSDYLDEIKYELDWLLTMQDDDGGLWHKLTAKRFESMDLMPHEALSQRYIVGKGTAATLDFAACMAQAHRVYQDYDPAFAEQMLSAAKVAWNWAYNHPSVAVTNPPDVSTGEYGDDDFTDEFHWAACELYLSTQEEVYRDFLLNNPIRLRYNAGESWTAYMSLLGSFSLLRNPDLVPASLFNQTKDRVIALADSLVTFARTNDYNQSISDFHWGSNSDVLNAAMLMAAAHQQSPKEDYLASINDHVDYILGKNALGYSFVTGYGSRPPMNIHHRQSNADDIEEPVPGLLSGGPNPRQQDKAYATYPENVAPMQSWVDQTGSYASNEVCMNWNAPLTYVLGWLNHQNNK